MKRTRLDVLLVERGLAESREKAQRLVLAGEVLVDDAPAAKPGHEVPSDCLLRVRQPERFVGRGGLKLEGALATTGLRVAGWSCLDVGQSTGGFTDCLLQARATRVVGVDVGSGQVHPRIRADERVTCIEGVNARELDASDLIAAGGHLTLEKSGFDAEFDLVTGDLSFISLTLVLPALAPLIKPGGHLLMLVKPQFELQPGQVGKGGIVRDPALYAVVEQRIGAACAALGLRHVAWFGSAITGGDGNREFFVHARQPSGH